MDCEWFGITHLLVVFRQHQFQMGSGEIVSNRGGALARHLPKHGTLNLPRFDGRVQISAQKGRIRHFEQMDTDQAELFATVYPAWNDLLIDGRAAENDSIIAEINGWDAKKAKFDRKRI
jgi:hypothetical protein